MTTDADKDSVINDPTQHINKKTRKFPEIKIPQFNCSQDSFDEFWAIFNQMVHLNQQFTPIEKFVYLTSHLTGRAANAIKGIKIIPQNYELALDIILKRFGNMDSNQTNIVQLIKSIEPANRSPESCRDEIIFEQFPVNIQEKLFLQIQTQKENADLNRHITQLPALITINKGHPIQTEGITGSAKSRVTQTSNAGRSALLRSDGAALRIGKFAGNSLIGVKSLRIHGTKVHKDKPATATWIFSITRRQLHLWTDFVRVTQASVILPSGLIIQPTIFGCSKSPTAE
uniref:Uncharacterized protein n=1 Tax=Heterorhabditis bacteriophora TaxID=37862 RepID=A0A1I7W8F1_HETBA